MSDFLSSPDPTDPITAWTDTRQISCIPTACRFDVAIPVQKPAFLKLIVSALALSKDATFPPMRAAGTCRNALLVLDRLQSLATLVSKQNRRSEATAMERSCNECRALRLIEGHEVNSGTQFNVLAQEFGIWGMYNLYSITTNQAPIAAPFRVVVHTEGSSGHA
jgi:hypothetical protein